MTLLSATIWAQTFTMDRSLQLKQVLTSATRRGGFLADGSVWMANYTAGPRIFTSSGVLGEELQSAEVFDGATTPGGRYAAMLTIDEQLWLLDSKSGDYRQLFSYDQARCVELSGDAERFWIGTEDQVCLLDRAGSTQSCGSLGSKSLTIALSPDEELLAVATTSGRVLVLDADDLRIRAELRAHKLRTPAVAWSPDGEWLVSASWDQSVRFWSVADMERPAAELIAELAQAWSMGLEEALERF